MSATAIAPQRTGWLRLALTSPSFVMGALLALLFIVVALGFHEDLLDVLTEAWLAPVVPSRALGQLRFVHASGFEQGAGGGLIELWVIPGRKIVVAARHLAFGVVSQECA